MKNKGKISLILIIIVILIISLCSCAQVETEAEDPIYYDDQAYSLTYVIDDYNYRMELDGQANCQIFRSAHSTTDYTNITCLMTGTFQINIQNIADFSTYFYVMPNKVLEPTTNYTERPASALSEVSFNEAYSLNLTVEEDGVSIDYEYSIVFYNQYNSKYPTKCDITRTMNVAEHKFAEGKYEIKEHTYVNLSFDLTEIPTTVIPSKELKENKEGTSSYAVDSNGYISIAAGSDRKYVQLYDDGSFAFGVAYTSTSSDACYTLGSYYSKTFTKSNIVYNEGERYTYDSTLTFEDDGSFTYTISNCSMESNYRIVSQTELQTLKYDIEDYVNLIGTHAQLNTSNNIAFANTFIVYVDYAEKHLSFTEDQIKIMDYGDYLYVYLEDSNKHTIGVYFYDDGTWAWNTSAIKVS